MELHEALYTTRAMRRLKPDPIPLDVQARILDAAIRAPHTGEGWRFLLVDDPELKAPLARLYRQASERLFEQAGINIDELLQSDSTYGRAARSGAYLIRHFEEVPLFLIGFSRTGAGGVFPALWSAMLAARAEGVGSTLTTIIPVYFPDELCALLEAPSDAGWAPYAVVPMGYPRGKWGVGARQPVEQVAARNRWQGDLGFSVPEPLWPA